MGTQEVTADEKAYSFSSATELMNFVRFCRRDNVSFYFGDEVMSVRFLDRKHDCIEVTPGTPSQCADFLVERFRKERGE